MFRQTLSSKKYNIIYNIVKIYDIVYIFDISHGVIRRHSIYYYFCYFVICLFRNAKNIIII